MTNYETLPTATSAVLHIFEQDGGWTWGITVQRQTGSGFKLIAFSEETFTTESEARCDGHGALHSLAGNDTREPTH